MLTNKTAWPLINVANNDSVDPGFNATLVQTAGSRMATFVDTLWHNNQAGKGIRPYVFPLYDPPTWDGVASNWHTTQGYPVPENLAYSNTALQSAGSDGFALGDLNWFPSQLAQFRPTSVKPTNTGTPLEFTLSQNYPNPFNPTTQISFTLSKSGNVELVVFNTLGQDVETLSKGTMAAGEHFVTFDAHNLASGVYFYRLIAGQNVSTMKMLLMK